MSANPEVVRQTLRSAFNTTGSVPKPAKPVHDVVVLSAGYSLITVSGGSVHLQTQLSRGAQRLAELERSGALDAALDVFEASPEFTAEGMHRAFGRIR